MQLRLCSLLLLTGLLLGVADGYTEQAMGFHEGARRTVRCDGGYLTGFDAWLGLSAGFSEPSVVAMRVKCSSGKINVEFLGSTSDDYVFGNRIVDTVKPQSVACPAGQGVAAIEWRRASASEKDHTARVGGFQIHCSTEATGQPQKIEASPGSSQEYPVALKCSDTSSPPKGERVRATGVEVWFEQQWSGLHLLECEVEKAR
ncbi:hypothetical protein OEZ85_011568 [Tetradesmus obliquus]|uniref:Secreted protein n=1 Tax=Tetradesmus obliquus TaxID=3088 RepID=A0ABY8TT55_TETOB|nr:hypothetical protein OEZ85_011568 [Tetradesmus obliquus]